jgi:hypothetical protein
MLTCCQPLLLCSSAMCPLKAGPVPLHAVQEHNMPPKLQAELAALERFCTTRFFGQFAEPLQPVTYRTVTKHYVQ